MATIPQLRPDSAPFADFFRVSTNSSTFPDMVDSCLAVLDSLGGYHDYPGLYRLSCAPEGSVKYGLHHRVGTIDFSGLVLRSLRSYGLLNELLHAIGVYPHRVTHLDATLDVVAHAPAYVRDGYKLGTSGKLKLTRKSVSRRHVSRVSRSTHYQPVQQTGTAYFGQRGASASLKIYDKRNEILDALLLTGEATPEWLALNDPGPLLRYELALGRNVGMTLRDVSDPSSIFWHHVNGSGLPLLCPEGVPLWEPHSEGYSLPPLPERLPWEQMKLILDNSPDVVRVVALAAKAGKAGPSMLVSLLQQRVEAILKAVDRPSLGVAEQGRVTVPA
jgi:hypothetical protein